jgi:hypothetical protein
MLLQMLMAFAHALRKMLAKVANIVASFSTLDASNSAS